MGKINKKVVEMHDLGMEEISNLIKRLLGEEDHFFQNESELKKQLSSEEYTLINKIAGERTISGIKYVAGTNLGTRALSIVKDHVKGLLEDKISKIDKRIEKIAKQQEVLEYAKNTCSWNDDGYCWLHGKDCSNYPLCWGRPEDELEGD